MTSPAKFRQVTQIMLQMWSCDQSLVTPAFMTEAVITSQDFWGDSFVIWDS